MIGPVRRRGVLASRGAAQAASQPAAAESREVVVEGESRGRFCLTVGSRPVLWLIRYRQEAGRSVRVSELMTSDRLRRPRLASNLGYPVDPYGDAGSNSSTQVMSWGPRLPEARRRMWPWGSITK